MRPLLVLSAICILAGLVGAVGSVRALEQLGPEPERLDCVAVPDACAPRFAAAFPDPPTDDAVRALSRATALRLIGRMGPQLLEVSDPQGWDQVYARLTRNPERAESGWVRLIEGSDTTLPSLPTLDGAPFEAWAEARADAFADAEVLAYHAALKRWQDSHRKAWSAASQKEHDDWSQQRTVAWGGLGGAVFLLLIGGGALVASRRR